MHLRDKLLSGSLPLTCSPYFLIQPRPAFSGMGCVQWTVGVPLHQSRKCPTDMLMYQISAGNTSDHSFAQSSVRSSSLWLCGLPPVFPMPASLCVSLSTEAQPPLCVVCVYPSQSCNTLSSTLPPLLLLWDLS